MKPTEVIDVTPVPTPETNQSYRINATPDPNSPTGVYIPPNLEEVITELDKMLPVALKLKLLEDNIWDYHFSLGLWLRNNWKLWENPPLVQNLVQMGASAHPDDLGSLLLQGYQKYLKSPLNYRSRLENPDEIYIKIQERLKLLLNCDRATLWVLDDGRQQLCAKVSISNKIQEVRISQFAGFAGKVIESKKTLNIPFDWYEHPENEEMRNSEMGSIKKTNYRVCSFLVMPIFTADEKIIGVVQLMNKIKPGQFPPYNPQNWPEAPECWQNSFSDDDEAFLEKLNQQIATLFTAESR